MNFKIILIKSKAYDSFEEGLAILSDSVGNGLSDKVDVCAVEDIP